ncbi:LytTR family transcriptional regulator [Aquimarina sp. AD10]|uniref:Transcriptional regulator n=1 Tax=Aquimarina aggregata TaxID=1642818 RepID=A0A162YJZ3_9FLAO|nr:MULTISPECIES: LytTR family transcriptional regulator [Aquimarina]AXT61083.1 LytTR family transcriptional regulator [Aquimarina sp. AD10]KZS39181.1 transcriptional regulator [Aquimarina aggregata]RKM92742.1 LytTR family transcriptional regulator [Aquimarina sp. AD10]
MRKDKLYFLTFISITIIFLIMASLGTQYFIRVSANQQIEVQIESSKREANEVASLISFQLMGGVDKKEVKENVQKTIENTNTETGFVCLFDWSGKEICHPDITKVGQKISSNQTLLSSLDEEINSNDLYDLLINKKDTKKGLSDYEMESEVIHLSPVKNSDWIVAAHVNVSKMNGQLKNLRRNFYIIFIIMGAIIIISSFLAVRLIGSNYEKQLELKNTSLETEVISLSKLNTDLVAYQQKVVKDPDPIEEQSDPLSDASKKRILTYIRHELIPVSIDEIAYIYTENTITHVMCANGKKSTSNSSLDDIYTSLDASLFFRANRQFIISIAAIEKIIKYGNSQLKILVQPDSAVEIIISKNKAAEFKQWLNL